MKARLNLVAGPKFQPRQYPGLNTGAIKSLDEGEVAWGILSELRTVLAFAERINDPRIEHVRGVVDRIAKLAGAFIRGRIGSLGFDDRARCEQLLQGILTAAGTGLREHPLADPHFQHRLRINAMLGIEFPWVIPPEPESNSAQLVRQLREQGWSAERILRDAQFSKYLDGADLKKLRDEAVSENADTKPIPTAAAPPVGDVAGSTKQRVDSTGGDASAIVESPGLSLTTKQMLVLKIMNQFDVSRLVSVDSVVEAADPANPVSLGTARKCLTALIEFGLAERPMGDRLGARLTLAGRRHAARMAD